MIHCPIDQTLVKSLRTDLHYSQPRTQVTGQGGMREKKTTKGYGRKPDDEITAADTRCSPRVVLTASQSHTDYSRGAIVPLLLQTRLVEKTQAGSRGFARALAGCTSYFSIAVTRPRQRREEACLA